MSPIDNNQQASFDTLIRPHLDRLYRLSFRLAGSKPEAEDLFQGVLTKIFRRRFARQRLVVVAEDQLASKNIESLPGKLDPARDAEQRDNITQLDAALNALSDEHRLVVMLHDCEGYKLLEIQELTGTPVGTLKSRLHRARARLREILTADGTKPGA